MIRANVTEDDEQTMARFLNGLNHPIKKIVDFQPYSNLIELVHQATKAERQVQDDFKYAKFSSRFYGFSNTQASTTPTPSTSTKPPTSNGDKSSYKKTWTSSSRPPTTSNFKPKASSSSTPTDETIRTSSFMIEAKVSRLSMRWWLSFWRKSTLTIRLRTCEGVAP